MEVVSAMLSRFEGGKLSRRQFVEGLAAIASTVALAPSAMGMRIGAPTAPVRMNHIAIGVSDLQRAKTWYTSVLRFEVIRETPHMTLLRFDDTEIVLRPHTRTPETAIHTLD
jgi:hypothetical protein